MQIQDNQIEGRLTAEKRAEYIQLMGSEESHVIRHFDVVLALMQDDATKRAEEEAAKAQCLNIAMTIALG